MTSERAFQQQVLDLASIYGWRSYHTFDSRRSTAGFPDLVLVRPPEMLLVELKRDNGRLSVPQQDWLRDLQLVAAAFAARGPAGLPGSAVAAIAPALEVFVWRPADFDEINERLRPRTPPRPDGAALRSVA